MFYASLVAQIIFLAWYLFSWPPENRSGQIFRFIGAALPVTGLLFHINWLIELSLFGYGLIIFRTIMSWITPSFPLMHAFTLRNLITGKIHTMIKNAGKEDMQVSFERPVTQKIILIVLSAICFIFTCIYFINITE